MASTSPLVMVFSQDTVTAGSKVNQAGSSNKNSNQQDASKSEQQPSSKVPRGRKPSKSGKSPSNKNKPRRRGMGIEKLERWLSPWGGGDHNLLPADVASDSPLHPHTYHQFQSTPPLIHMAASPSVYVGTDLLMSRSPASFMASSSKLITTLGGGGACGKELSSIPKVMQCDASCYFKNKCMNTKEMQGMILGGMDNQEKIVFPSSQINCHMLSGLNHGHDNIGSEMKEFNSRSAMRQMIYNQDYEMMGITRPQVSSSCSTLKEYEFFPPGKSLKEYEFFPGTTSGGSYTRSSVQPTHYYTTEPAAASSYFIQSSDFGQSNAASATNSNALDLSLKLSL